MNTIRLGNDKSKTLVGEIVSTGTHYYEGRNGVFVIWDKRYDGPCIYSIMTFPSGHIYVGLCRNYTKRANSHRKALFCNIHCNPKLQRVFNKNQFAIIKIEEKCGESELSDLEIYYMDYYKTLKTEKGCNMVSGGNCSYVPTEEQKRNVKSGRGHKSKRKVFEYGLDGAFLKEWECAMDAVRFYGYEKSRIDQVASFKKKSKSFMGKMWRYFKSEKIEPIQYDGNTPPAYKPRNKS